MAEIVFSQEAADKLRRIENAGVLRAVIGRVSTLESFPEIGSRVMSERMRFRYGEDIRKLVVRPFDVIYRFDSSVETVWVIDLVHQRTLR